MFSPQGHAIAVLAPARKTTVSVGAADTCATGALGARLLDQLRERIRYLHYSIRIEEA